MRTSLFSFLLFSIACTNAANHPAEAVGSAAETSGKKQHFEGAFTNGMKDTYISFDISADGKNLEGLTFKGWWRCSGSLEQTTLGPKKSFPIKNNKVDGVVAEPENDGSSALRYELHTTISGAKAEGTLRMNLNALSCDTYVLKFVATRK